MTIQILSVNMDTPCNNITNINKLYESANNQMIMFYL